MPKVIIGGREYVVKESKKPTGLAITRKDNTFKFSWKIGDKNYAWGQQLYYKTNQMKKWERLSCGARVTNKSIALNMSRYIPTTEKALRYIRFKVRGQREPYAKHAGTRREKRYAPSMSDFAVKEFEIKKPHAPKVTAELNDELANRTKFSWETSTSDSSNRYFSIVQWQTVLLKNSNVTKGEDAFSQKQKSSRVSGTWESGTGSANSSKNVTEDLTYINGTDSYTRWFRARARGPAGSSDWTYSRHVYARTNATSNAKATAIKEARGYKVTVEWSSSAKAARPINQMVVQSWVTAPGAGMDVPEGSGWQDMMTVAYKDGTDKAIFYVDDVLTDDQVIFVRVNTQHDPGVPATPGTPVIAEVGTLATPTITSVTPVESTHRATIVASNASSVPDSFLAVYYQSDEDEPMIVGIIEHGETTATVQAPDWSTAGAYAFGVQAVVGTYSEQEGPGGLTVYAIQSYEGKPLMTSGITWGAGAVPKAPENVAVTATDATGVLRVNWDWTWTEATSAEISWSQNPYAWESNEQPATYTVSNANASQWYITGLDVGVEWYVRVRLAKGSGDELLYGPYSEPIRVSLASAPSVPTLVLSDAVIPGDGTVTASWAYVSTDGTAQAYAEICTATLSQSGITYGDVIATTETAQHIDINAAEVGWTVGETYLLCLRVVSASGRTSDDWSAPVALAIAEPLTAEITQTSLVEEAIGENPREFSGEIVSFENESEVGAFTSLTVDINAEQDLNGYSSPWPGGGGINLLPAGEAKTETIRGITFTSDGKGTYTIRGTATANASCSFACEPFVIPTSDVTGFQMLNDTATASAVWYFRNGTTNSDSWTMSPINKVAPSYGTMGGRLCDNYTIIIQSGAEIDMTLSPMLTLKSAYPSATFEPFENICPITGHDSATVTQAGQDYSLSTENGFLTTTGDDDSSNGQRTQYMEVEEGDVLDVSWTNNATGYRYTRIAYYDANKNFVSTIYNAVTADRATGNQTLTIPNGVNYVRVGTSDGVINKAYVIKQTYSTALGPTVYGGTLDIVSGVLTITHVSKTYNGTESWLASAQTNPAYFVLWSQEPSKSNTDTTQKANWLIGGGNTYQTFGYYRAQVNGCVCVGNRIGTTDYKWADATELKAYLSENPLQIVYEFATPTTTTLTAQQVELLLGENNIWADTGDVSVRVVDSVLDVTSLKDMPLTVTVTGAGNTGITTVAVERAESYYLERPDERNFTGHEGETVALIQQTGEAQITIDDSVLFGTLDDGAKYRIVATVSDELGQSTEATQDFEVRWTHQALIPTATIEADNNFKVMKITPVAPAGVETGDTCDIYRLSVDRPELIYPGAEFGTTYVDPYPALGEMGGHRIVFRTANGDYITEDNTLAWTDYTAEDGDTIETMFNLIDFGGNQVAVMYDIELSSAWDKDFEETQYLGGHVTGDWNQAVSRTGSVQGSLVTTQDQDTIQALRRLADYPGICHVRTRDGSSYAADVQVNESRDMGKDVVRSEFSLAITRVDPEGYDGMTLADWQRTQEPEEATVGTAEVGTATVG